MSLFYRIMLIFLFIVAVGKSPDYQGILTNISLGIWAIVFAILLRGEK